MPIIIKKLCSWFFSNMAWLLLCMVVAAICASFSSWKIYGNLIDGEKVRIVYLILLCLCIVIDILCFLFCGYYFIDKSKKRRKTCEEEQTRDFAITKPEVEETEFESELFFQTRSNIEATRIAKFLVVADCLKGISYSMIWTGSRYLNSEIVEAPSSYKLIDSTREASPHKFYLDFGTELKKGDTGEYRIITRVADGTEEAGVMGNYSMDPYLGKMVKSKMEKLILRVVVPDKLIRTVRKRMYADTVGELPITEYEYIKAKKIGNLFYYEWEVENPELLRVYRIEWEFCQ